jgi:DNA-binding beta-propeller fold protein YncE
MTLISLVLLTACSKDATDAVDSGDSAAANPVPAFGANMDPAYTVVGDGSDGLATPRDLGFHPSRDELWVVNKTTDGVVIYEAPGTNDQSADEKIDFYSNHFMETVSSLAWGDASADTDGEESFASCQESRNTYDGQGNANDFMGPTLWPGDRDLFAKVHQGNGAKLGSHLDMLHASPNCMGIAHDSDNAYWVFDGKNGHLVYYDFAKDHGPGGEFHGDGVIRRYKEVELDRKKNIPGHLELDKDSGLLYIADTGNGRVVEVDTSTGEVAGNIQQTMEPLEEFSKVEGVSFRTLVDGLSKPSGLALDGETLFIGDNGTGEIIAYNLDGEELGRIQTPAESLMGLAVGPDGSLWYVDADAEEVVRVDPS